MPLMKQRQAADYRFGFGLLLEVQVVWSQESSCGVSRAGGKAWELAKPSGLRDGNRCLFSPSTTYLQVASILGMHRDLLRL